MHREDSLQLILVHSKYVVRTNDGWFHDRPSIFGVLNMPVNSMYYPSLNTRFCSLYVQYSPEAPKDTDIDPRDLLGFRGLRVRTQYIRS